MSEVRVRTTAGELRGTQAEGVAIFKGIPYAGPPTGRDRWRPPTPVAPWDGVRDATAYAPSCPQVPERPADWPQEHGEDEDSLVLNVWTPAVGDGGRRPVMVWYHGGGFTIGSGSWPHYEGSALVRRGDVVVVTVNHRLGLLGYLHLGELAGAGYESSGNAGMLDLVQGLEWVRDEIAAFGGDPGNVTIFGESGGGAKVATLLAMPAARGLFHRAVIQSGPRLRAHPVAQATEVAKEVLAELGLTGADVDALAEVPVERLIAAQRAVIRHHGVGFRGFGPVLDGTTLPIHPGDALVSGQAADVPILIGTTRDEATFFLSRDPAFTQGAELDEAGLRERLSSLGDHADAVLAGYRAARPSASPLDLLIAIQSDQVMRIPSIELAERKLRGGGADVYMYLFCWAAGVMRSAHGFEVPFVFDNARPPVMRDSPSRDVLGARMSQAWINFARHGDPSHDDLPDWPPYSTERRATMLFDRDECTLVDDPFGAERRVWTAVGAPAGGI